jgi:heterotetrameric sarcosine oxidase gamma subunit
VDEPRSDLAGPSPIARSPIPTVAPTTIVAGWEVTDRTSAAPLRLADLSPLAKVHVRAGEDGPLRSHLGVGFLRAAEDEHGVLVTGSGPGEWTLIGPVGTARQIASRIAGLDLDERVSVVDLTHGRALLRLTGGTGPDLLAGVCALHLDDRNVPDGTCLRTSVAAVVTDVVRDDRLGERSYLLHCERSSGAYLAARLLEVGRRHGVEVEGFTAATA